VKSEDFIWGGGWKIFSENLSYLAGLAVQILGAVGDGSKPDSSPVQNRTVC
jgi:hypothetical protein